MSLYTALSSGFTGIVLKRIYIMKILMNITDYCDDLARYKDAQYLNNMIKSFGLDGLEVMPSAPDPLYPFLDGQVTGVHMRCQSDWLDLWNNDTDALNREYGSPDVWESVFHGSSRSVLLQRAREDLEYARAHHAQYVVFHISNVRTTDILTNRFSYSDEDVIRASAQLINELLSDYTDAPFYFLMENLWWPGLCMTDPALTKLLLELVEYPKKGIMLDLGHFLHTNNAIRTQADAIAYIRRMLSGHRSLLHFIKGVHLHQTLSGAYTEKYLRSRQEIPSDYQERFIKAMYHVLAIDSHEPFTDPDICDVLRQISPDFLTLEFISRDINEHKDKLRRQLDALQGLR